MIHEQLINMRPSVSVEDVAYLRLADSEPKGDVFLKHRPFQSTNLKDVFTRQLRGSTNFAARPTGQTGSVGMLHVLRTINPLKVVNHIIGFVAINMVDMIPRWISVRNKGNGYQSVDSCCRLSVLAAERGENVSELAVDRKFENATGAGMPTLPNPLNPSVVTDRIKRFVSRGRFPLFNIHIYQCKPSPVWSQL